MAGLYIHIPFCRSKCIYCDFYSSPSMKNMEAVVDGLLTEFNARRAEIRGDFETIYIGGGTPSVLPPELLRRLISGLPVDDAVEFTIEVNPDDVNTDTVAAWRDCGINRVSMGVQALDDTILKRMGRRHSASQALGAVATLIDGGIGNISADLIYGLPWLTDDAWRSELRTMFGTGINHLSAYCLTYHEGTMLYKMMESGRVNPADDDTVASQFEILGREAAKAGFEHYEISNLAHPGYRSRHNSAYWDPGHIWLGIGPSAHSFDGRVRRIDVMPASVWLERLPQPFDIDEEDALDLVNDNIVTALRTADGLDLSTVPDEYRDGLLKDAASFIESGDMIFDGKRLTIRRSRWLTSDYYIRNLLRVR